MEIGACRNAAWIRHPDRDVPDWPTLAPRFRYPLVSRRLVYVSRICALDDELLVARDQYEQCLLADDLFGVWIRPDFPSDVGCYPRVRVERTDGLCGEPVQHDPQYRL